MNVSRAIMISAGIIKGRVVRALGRVLRPAVLEALRVPAAAGSDFWSRHTPPKGWACGGPDDGQADRINSARRAIFGR